VPALFGVDVVLQVATGDARVFQGADGPGGSLSPDTRGQLSTFGPVDELFNVVYGRR
jgi:hypothetical protein